MLNNDVTTTRNCTTNSELHALQSELASLKLSKQEQTEIGQEAQRQWAPCERDALQVQQDACATQLATTTKERDRLQGELTAKHEEMAAMAMELTGRVQAAYTECDALKLKVHQTDKDADMVEVEEETSTVPVAVDFDTLFDMRSDVNDESTRMAELTEEWTRKQAGHDRTVNALEHQIRESQQREHDAKKTLSQLRVARSLAQKARKHLQTEARANDKENKAVQLEFASKLDSARKECAELRARINAQSVELASLSAGKAYSAFSAQRGTISALRRRFDEKMVSTQDREQAWVEKRIQYEKTIHALEAKIGELEEEAVDHTAIPEEAELNNKHNEIAALMQRVGAQEQEIRALQQEREARETEMASEHAALRQEIVELKGRLKEEAEEFKFKQQQQKDKTAALQLQLQGVSRANGALRQEKQDLMTAELAIGSGHDGSHEEEPQKETEIEIETEEKVDSGVVWNRRDSQEIVDVLQQRIHDLARLPRQSARDAELLSLWNQMKLQYEDAVSALETKITNILKDESMGRNSKRTLLKDVLVKVKNHRQHIQSYAFGKQQPLDKDNVIGRLTQALKLYQIAVSDITSIWTMI